MYSYALAKHEGGNFILRIEDTDKKRQVKGAVESLKKTLKTFGLDWDEYYVQSQRLELYKKAAKKLVEKGYAYHDSGAIRIKIPKSEDVSFYDFALKKEITWNSDTLKDLVLLKSNGFPTYHLAVVVDDHDMGITHILRGHDWLPSTPIHLLIYKALGYEIPQIGHLTDILDPEGGKLSKRKRSASVDDLLSQGYLPPAILNFIMLLGWAPKNNKEIFTLKEFVKAFNHGGFQKANPVFNQKKLDWFNGKYIRKLSTNQLSSKLEALNPKFETMPKDKKIKITKLIKDRIKKLVDFSDLAKFFWEEPVIDKKLFGENYKVHLQKAKEAIEKGVALEKVPKKNNFNVGDFFMDLRIAVTGSKFTPPINESIEILGKEETLKRLKSV